MWEKRDLKKYNFQYAFNVNILHAYHFQFEILESCFRVTLLVFIFVAFCCCCCFISFIRFTFSFFFRFVVNWNLQFDIVIQDIYKNQRNLIIEWIFDSIWLYVMFHIVEYKLLTLRNKISKHTIAWFTLHDCWE